MWRTYRNLMELREDESEFWRADMMHGRFCRLKGTKKSTKLALYYHFRSKMDFKALEEIFEEGTRKECEKLMEKIDVPKIERMMASYHLGKLKRYNSRYLMIFKCHLCKKELKGLQNTFKQHIGQHEDIPSYCFMKGCSKHFRSYSSLRNHIIQKHDLREADLDSTQYHYLQSAKVAYFDKAATFMDRYFPPESFVRFNDRKVGSTQSLEDVKCCKCGEEFKHPVPRRHHVAAHLGLSTKCVIEGCEATFLDAYYVSAHLSSFHKKRLKDLSERELYAHKMSKEEFNKIMKMEVSKYFPMRIVKDEDSE
ncbi:hypothetical protein L596_009343 [Steinernema carpocapsae]|uniref:C2H2-type domain-containing protein n=1 Tax=Steinernema carpocapsae TaxID=34508 RepID=A0A4V6A6Q0_STECR|nr:hypothetical protein L596_009343 [Steinernema carpocapsae]